MVKIIDEEPHKSVVKEKVCKNCGCTLSYTPLDVKENTGYNERDGYWGHQWIVCPKCSKNVTIKAW